MLALVWAKKYFRCYLFGAKFVARTDHAALTYLKNFADSSSRLMRWSLKLSELDFSVEHRPGTKIAHVDALRRHVGVVWSGGTLSQESVLREQAKDKFCAKIKPVNYPSKCEFFRYDVGLVYRRQPSDKHQLLVPQALVHDVIRQNHDPAYAAHPGVKRTCDLIALHFWWPGMRRPVEDYIRKCDACQRRKENREFIAPLGDPEMPVASFQITSMDITGLYPLTPRRNKHILTFIDHFTEFVEAFAIPDQSAQTCARIYATQIVTRHGSGSRLVTDQGAAFMSAFFSETCKVLIVQRSRTFSYHPAFNGTLER